MRHLIISILISFITLNFVNAQDIIIKQNGEKIDAIISEISKDEIKYKDFSNQEGPVFILSTNEIASILFQNGDTKVFSKQNQKKVLPQNLKSLTANGNLVFIDFTDPKNNLSNGSKPLFEALENWGYWEIVDNKEDADFVLMIKAEKKGPGLTSTGARVFIEPAIYTLNGKELWRGDVIKGDSNMYNGFNAYKEACKKLIKELEKFL